MIRQEEQMENGRRILFYSFDDEDGEAADGGETDGEEDE